MIYGKGLYLREVVKEDIDRAYELCVNDDVLKYDGGYTSFASKEYIKENSIELMQLLFDVSLIRIKKILLMVN